MASEKNPQALVGVRVGRTHCCCLCVQKRTGFVPETDEKVTADNRKTKAAMQSSCGPQTRETSTKSRRNVDAHTGGSRESYIIEAVNLCKECNNQCDNSVITNVITSVKTAVFSCLLQTDKHQERSNWWKHLLNETYGVFNVIYI